jgi:hypothetical protein
MLMELTYNWLPLKYTLGTPMEKLKLNADEVDLQLVTTEIPLEHPSMEKLLRF